MRYLIYIIVSFLIFTSCNHKDLCYHHPHTAKVRIDVDWSEFDKETPTGMTVMIYPQADGQPIRHLTNTTTHAIVDLEAGLYNTIVYNQSDTEYGSVIFVDMEEFATAKVLANEAESRWYSCRAEDEKLAKQPEWIGTDTGTDAVVTPEMVEAEAEEFMANISQKSRTRSEYVIESLVPQNIIHTINVKVHLKGIYNLRSARASLTGLAEGYSFAASEPTESQVTQLLESWSMTQNADDPTQGYITAKITSMGLPYGHQSLADENEFTLSVLLVDNKTVVDIPFVVGDKLRKRYNEAGEYTYEIDLELWAEQILPDVKPEGSNDGGFDATVDDWGEEHNVDLNL